MGGKKRTPESLNSQQIHWEIRKPTKIQIQETPIPGPVLTLDTVPLELADRTSDEVPEVNALIPEPHEHCTKCGTDFINLTGDDTHLARDSDDKIICFECAKTFCKYCGYADTNLIPIPGTFYVRHPDCGTFDPSKNPNKLRSLTKF